MITESSDPYRRLKPACVTPEDEICGCPRGTAIMLRDGLSANPLFCVACNGEVPPERLELDWQFVEDIFRWLSAYNALYKLWLNSGEYEAWAAARLADPNGQVNRDGREIVARLNTIVPAYYWWFVDVTLTEPDQVTNCPVCSTALQDYDRKAFKVCCECRILA